ncbi:cytochrome P450 [Nocardia aurantia]|uniref:Polyketide biosynthesis cytochrome P450 PksS n=1 Tax=Nocardia aurantia TaxID=2585199 RepID=A0A7K0DNT2_9NOCA|nr:cytochrome P450 [Nocardia aurantia]MQY27403.1 Polyketide biosynthesis cytochrome P450 PksS [Nocardia aurantia]
MAATPPVFDPFAPGYADDPYPHYARLRDRAPVHEHPLGFWIVSRYRDVAALQRAAQSVDEQYLTRLPTWKSDSGTLGKRNRMMGGLSLLDQDPPDHTRLRRLVSKAFGPRAVQALRPRIEHHVDTALDRIAATGGADVLPEFAFPLPFAVISELLGIPVLESTRLRELVGTLVLALEPLPDPALQARIRAADTEVLALVADLIAWKRAHLADDVLTRLIAAEHDGDVLNADELAAQVVLLYIAGHETTVNLLANGILALLRHPGQARQLRTGAVPAADAVEELLRYDTPVHLMRRVTVTPFTANDIEIPSGSWVVACLGAANRDPAFWGDDAGRLRLDRPDAGRHLSFGAGIHHCLGAGLARLEAEIAFAAFARRFPHAELLELEHNGRINVRGPARLTISV